MPDNGLQGLAIHLRNLLSSTDKLVVPGFGTFRAETRNARIHPVTHDIQPPNKEITFDANIQDDDGVLIAFLAKKLPARKDTVKKQLTAWVNEFRDELQKHPRILEGIGTFKLVGGKEVKFTPFEENNFLADSYGLRPINASAILRGTTIVQEDLPAKSPLGPELKEPAKDTADSVKEPVQSEKVTLQPTVPAEKPETNMGSRKRNFSLALFIIPMLACIVIGYRYFDDFTKVVWMLSQSENNVTQGEQSFVTESPTPAEFVASDDTAGHVPAVEEDMLTLNYFIVAGCFKSEHNANNLVNDLRNRGFEASIQGTTPLGLLRVCYQGFADSLQADASLKKILASENPTAWLLDLHQSDK